MAFKQRPVAPQAAIGWRVAFPLALVGLAVATFFLAREGADLVLDTNAGEFIEAVTDPAEAGYEAFVRPTETVLVTVTDDGGALVGVALLSPATDLGGGTVIVVPPGLTVEDPDSSFGFELLADIHAEEGPDVVRAHLRSIFGIGFSSEVELDADAFRSLVEPYTPLPYDLAYTLESIDEDSGAVTTLLQTQAGLALDADTSLLVFGHRNDDEEGVNRLDRQGDFYAALLGEVRAIFPTPDDTEEVAAVRDALGELGSAGTERVIIQNLDVVAEPFTFIDGSLTVLHPNLETIDDQLLAAVPLPQSPEPGARPSFQLTNGVGDIGQNPAAIERLVRAGGVLGIIANTDTPDVEISQLRYRVDEQAAAAEEMAQQLGVSRVVQDVTLSELVDFEFVLGRDLVVN